MNPFFSIIIPTYNRAQIISNAINSIIEQNFSDWELIIIDDGSTDNTKEIVQSYKDKRIKYFFQQNAERSVARNNGINNSAGNYICFLDSDDYYCTNRLVLLFKELENRSFPEMAFYTGLVFETNGILQKREEGIKAKNIFDQLVLSVLHSQQVCIHQTILKEFNYDKRFHIGEDMELWLRIANKYPFIYFDNQYTIVVVDHDDRSVNVKRYNSYVDQLQMFKFIFRKPHAGHMVSSNVKQQLISNAYFGIAKYHLYRSSFLKANYNLLRAIVTDISSNQTKYRINIFLQTIPIIGNKNKLMRLIENKA